MDELDDILGENFLSIFDGGPPPAPITFKLRKTSGYFKRTCHVCGGLSDDQIILPQTDDGLQMCERCVEERDFDATLNATPCGWNGKPSRCAP